MIVRQKYVTRLKPVDIDNWIKIKKNEKFEYFFKFRHYRANSDEYGFFIREVRYSEYQNFKPRIIGKYISTDNNKTEINLTIIPSITGMIFYSVFIIALIPFFIPDYINYFKIDNSDILVIAILFPILIFIMIRSLILPVYKAKSWIIDELKLKKIINGSSQQAVTFTGADDADTEKYY